ncbi:MAG TPA: hypothetical protein PLQ11_05880 [Beijerinckiaceae bacterium]|nr:hypothetical protein [Beijerinckiaceae bacterium]
MDTKVEIAGRLIARMNDATALRGQARGDEKAMRSRALLRSWQSQRLARTHADLLADARFHDAAQFFLDELYGLKDTAQRDADATRVAPTLARVLPEAGLETVADAAELDAISEEFDAAMVRALGRKVEGIDSAGYAAAYRKVGRKDDRLRQIGLVEHLGQALDRLTRRAFAGTALKMMRKPAELAGFADLQAFLQTGYDAFRKMGSAEDFLNRIISRERAIVEALFAGNDAVLDAGPEHFGVSR